MRGSDRRVIIRIPAFAAPQPGSILVNSSIEKTKRELIEIIHTRFAAFKNDDIPSLEKYLADEATIWDVFVPQLIRGSKARRAYRQADHEQMRARGRLTINIEEPVIDVWGKFAVARYYLDFSYQPPNPASGTVRITDVFKNKDGKWLIVHHHEGLVPTGIPPIARA